MSDKINIYEKLQTVRVELQKMNLKKSGKNKFVGYDYFELCDFIPQINDLMLKHKMTSVLWYNDELAILDLINIEDPKEIIKFTSPMSEANLKGTHAVQNLGAVETYLRRYLYITAFEIVESDVLDASHDKDDKTSTPATTDANLGLCEKGSGLPHTPEQARECPICGGEMWNNIERKTNPKAPDYKCKDKDCAGVIWPKKAFNPDNLAIKPELKPEEKQTVVTGSGSGSWSG